MNNTQDIGIIKNMDNVSAINAREGEFLLDFDMEQQKILKYALDKGYSIRGFAYPTLPAVYMQAVLDIVFENKTDNPILDAEIWKAVHCDVSLEQFKEILIGYGYDLDMPQKLKDIRKLPATVLALVVAAKSFGADITEEVNNCNGDYRKINELVGKIRDKSEKKEKKRKKFMTFIYG